MEGQTEAKTEKVFVPPAGFKEVKSALWIPEIIGESISGIVQGMSVDDERGKSWTILTDDGTIKVTPSHKVLQSRMEASGVRDGEKVAIVYDGEELPKNKNFKPTRIYRVFIVDKR